MFGFTKVRSRGWQFVSIYTEECEYAAGKSVRERRKHSGDAKLSHGDIFLSLPVSTNTI